MRCVAAGGSQIVIAAALWWLAPPGDLPVGLRTDLRRGADPMPAVLHLCALGAWLAVAWLLLATATAVAARLPGAVGRLAGALAGLITPTVLRRAIGGGAAVGIAFAPALVPSVASAAACLPGLDRAVVACVPTTTPPVASPPTTSPPVTTPPATTGHPARAAVAPTTTRSPAAATSPSGTAAAPPGTTRSVTGPAASGPSTVTVRAGDSLWSIATAELRASGRPASPAAVAARWPAWWTANRAAVGADPDLIYPGTVLSVPAASEAPR